MSARGRESTEAALIILGFLLFAFVLIHHPLGDDIDRLRAASSWLETGAMPSIRYSMIGPMLAAPFYFLGRTAGSAEKGWTLFGLISFAAVFGLIAFRSALPGARRFVAVVMTASMIPHALIGNGAELFTTVFAGGGLLALALGRPALGWAGIALAAANAPAVMIGAGLVALAHAYKTRRLRWLAAPVAAVAVVLAENWLRRGNLLVTGYEGLRMFQTVLPYSGGNAFGFPFWFGVLAILFSFGKGLLFFAPGLMLVPWARARAKGPAADFLDYSLLFLLGLVLVYAKCVAWYGGWTWGPRLFLFAAIPASLMLSISLDGEESAPWGALALLGLSCWVGLSGVIYSYAGLELATAHDYALEHLVWYTPEFSVLWRPLTSGTLFAPEHWIWLAYFGAAWLAFAAPFRRSLSTELSAFLQETRGRAGKFAREARW